MADDVVEHNEVVSIAGGGQLNEPWQLVGGYFHQGVFTFREGSFFLAQVDGEVEVCIGEEGVDAVFYEQHGHHEGEEVVFEVILNELLLYCCKFQSAEDEHVVFSEFGDNLFFKNFREFFLLLVDDLVDIFEEDTGFEVELGFGFFAYFFQFSDTGYTDTEKLIEVGGVDGQKFESFEQWDSGVFGFLEHAVVEGKPRNVAVGIRQGMHVVAGW